LPPDSPFVKDGNYGSNDDNNNGRSLQSGTHHRSSSSLLITARTEAMLFEHPQACKRAIQLPIHLREMLGFIVIQITQAVSSEFSGQDRIA